MATVITPIPAAAPPTGLLPSAVRPTNPGDGWENGFRYEPEGCVAPKSPLDICSPATKGTGDLPGATVEWEPYILWSDYRCSSAGFNSFRRDDATARARRRLEASQQFQLERELWAGTLAQAESYRNRWLADVTNVDILSESGPVGLTHGLACLSQYLAETNGGQQGMIHATPQVVTHWVGLNLLYKRGSVLYTIARDDVVVPGNGYTGGDPDGNDPVSQDVWAYATDLVEIRLGDVLVTGAEPEQFNRSTNEATIRAERVGVASWDGCRHAGLQLAVDICDVGGS